LGTHPNVGAALVVAFGCECLDFKGLVQDIEKSGRQARLIIVNKTGSSASIEEGRNYIRKMTEELAQTPRCVLSVSDLIIGMRSLISFK
jgi:altronate dehydratase large subunit